MRMLEQQEQKTSEFLQLTSLEICFDECFSYSNYYRIVQEVGNYVNFKIETYWHESDK